MIMPAYNIDSEMINVIVERFEDAIHAAFKEITKKV